MADQSIKTLLWFYRQRFRQATANDVRLAGHRFQPVGDAGTYSITARSVVLPSSEVTQFVLFVKAMTRASEYGAKAS